MMQLNLFEDVDNRQTGIEYVTKVIMRSDSIRGYIKTAIDENDRPKLVKLFQESINTFGFGFTDYSWHLGKLEDSQSGETYEVNARELADMALRLNQIRRD